MLLNGVLALVSMQTMKKVRSVPLPQKVDLSRVKDGTYTGSCTISRWATTVQVQVQEQQITGLAVAKEMQTASPEGLFEELSRNVIEKQSLAIDAVSGASINTRAYLIAIADALTSAAVPMQ